jgi:hypothetical protein
MINKDKNFNDRTKPPRCTMCNRILNESDINGDFSYHKWIGYGSRYDENRLDLVLCGNCFDKVVSFIVNNSANNPLKEYDEKQENGYFVRYLVSEKEEQIMGNDFDSIGVKHIKSMEDMVNFYNTHLGCVSETIVGGEKYSILSDGEGMELFFYGDSEKVWLNYCEPYYKPEQTVSVISKKWVRPDGNNGQNYLQVQLTEYDIPLNVCVPDFYKLKDIKAKSVKNMDVICFINYINVYQSEEDFQNDHSGFARESIIPCGVFPANPDKNFKQDNTMIMNGKIVWVKEKENILGGGKFFHVGVECLGVVFEIVIEEEFTQDYNIPLEIGNIVHGLFKLVGKVVI